MKLINRLVFAQIIFFGFSLFGQNSKAPSNKLQGEIKTRADREYANLELLYQHLHATPELSFHEEKTAARLADELEKTGFTVTRQLGGHGLVGVLDLLGGK